MRFIPNALHRAVRTLTWLTGFTLAIIAVFFFNEKFDELVLEESIRLSYAELYNAEDDYEYFIHSEGTLLLSKRPDGGIDELCVTWTQTDHIVALEEVKVLTRLYDASERTLGLLLLRGRVTLSEIARLDEIRTLSSSALELYAEFLPLVEPNLDEESCFQSRYSGVEL